MSSLEFATLVGGQRVVAHPARRCQPPCAVHAPSRHHMVTWPQLWHGNRGVMERICEHGEGHIDPDDRTPDRDHGCDGCCDPAPPPYPIDRLWDVAKRARVL